MAGKDRKTDGDESALWRAVTHDVTPNPDRNKPDGARNSKAPKTKKQQAANPKPQRAAARAAAAEVKPAVEITTEAAPKLDAIARRKARRLKKGNIAIDDRIDLHGLSRDAAHSALFRFVPGASAAGHRHVLVVTGKGKGILREAVSMWLTSGRLAEYVISVSPAPQTLGGGGAFYLELRRTGRRAGSGV